jgi:hypothetical protein
MGAGRSRTGHDEKNRCSGSLTKKDRRNAEWWKTEQLRFFKYEGPLNSLGLTERPNCAIFFGLNVAVALALLP